MVQNWNPRRPLVIGGLGQGEERMGVMRIRFKRHRYVLGGCGLSGLQFECVGSFTASSALMTIPSLVAAVLCLDGFLRC